MKIMKKLSPYVVSKSVEDGIILFNTKNNISIKVTNNLISKIENDKSTQLDFENYLISKNFYSEESEFEKSIAQIFDKENEMLRITVLTHGDCNFRCLYCYEKFENIAMSQATMDNIVKFTEQKILEGNYKKLRASWFGGEPLLGYKVIVYLSSKFQELAAKYNLDYVSDITTNGYLLDKRKLTCLVEVCKCVFFQITIDGNLESHDKQRVLKNGKGSFERIYANLLKAKETLLKFDIVLRFNVSKDNYKNVKDFMINEGVPFKNDKRFSMLYRNVGDWGQGDRKKGYEIERLSKEITFQFSEEALSLGYQLIDPFWSVNNQFSCYAQNPNHFAFNVRGKIMACTVLLYDTRNIFGDVNIGILNQEKRQKYWIQTCEKIPKKCLECEIVLICKGGTCPKLNFADNKTQEYICNKNKNKFYQNLDLFIKQNLYEVTLDAE